METVTSGEVLDNTDGVVTNTILKTVLKLSEILKNNIYSLKLPEIFKIALKKIRSLLNLQTDRNAEHAGESKTASETARYGSEEHRGVRNRRFKIKRIMAHPKNIEVKQNGRVVRRMAVRRCYPAHEEITIKNKH